MWSAWCVVVVRGAWCVERSEAPHALRTFALTRRSPFAVRRSTVRVLYLIVVSVKKKEYSARVNWLSRCLASSEQQAASSMATQDKSGPHRRIARIARRYRTRTGASITPHGMRLQGRKEATGDKEEGGCGKIRNSDAIRVRIRRQRPFDVRVSVPFFIEPGLRFEQRIQSNRIESNRAFEPFALKCQPEKHQCKSLRGFATVTWGAAFGSHSPCNSNTCQHEPFAVPVAVHPISSYLQ